MKSETTILLGALYLLGAVSLNACSVAFYTGTDDTGKAIHLTGRTADLTSDYFTVEDKISVYPRGKEQKGYTDNTPLVYPNTGKTWTSRYGCLIMDDFVDGFNEKGLCVHPLFLDKSEYPEQDGTTQCVSTLKVTLYLLGNAATVTEALELLDGVIVVAEDYKGKPLPMHWAIRDAANNVAFIEFVGKGTGKKKKSEKMVYQGIEYDVLTNEPYLDIQLKYYSRFAKGKRGLPGDFNSMARFVRLKMFKKTLPAGKSEWENVTNIFSLMSSVHCVPGAVDYSGHETEDEWPTVWTTVTDMDNWKYYIKITNCPNIVWIDFGKFDFNSLTKIGTIDMDNPNLNGEVNGQINWE